MSEKNPRLNVTATTAAAATNHFSCRRSSPVERRNLTTTEAKDSSIATGYATAATTKTASAYLGTESATASWDPANGSAQTVVAKTAPLNVRNRRTAAESHATGRQRREGRCPVGNRRSRNGSRQIGIGNRTVLSQAMNRPPGRNPGSASRTWAE